MPQVALPQRGQGAVALAIQEPGVQARCKFGAIGMHQVGLLVAGEGAELPHTLESLQPDRCFQRIGDHCIDLPVPQCPAHCRVLRDRGDGGPGKVDPGDALKVPALVHADSCLGLVERCEVGEARVLAHQDHRAAGHDGDGEDPGEGAFGADGDPAHAYVEAVCSQVGEQVGPAKSHHLELSMLIRRVGAGDCEVEALELRRVSLRREAEGRVVSADSDPKRWRVLCGRKRGRRDQRQERRKESLHAATISRSWGMVSIT